MEIIKDMEFYNLLTDSEKSLVMQTSAKKSYGKGERIHGDNGECSGMLIVLSGKLRAYMLSEQGREITLYYLEKDEICIMSASCVMNCIAFEVHIEADSHTTVVQIPAQTFSTIEKQNIYMQNYALKLAVERFSDVMWAMQQLLFFSMDKRLAMYLYDESSKAKTLELIVTHEEIAKSLASAREVVTRILQNFQKAGIVELSRGKIAIKDTKALASLCD